MKKRKAKISLLCLGSEIIRGKIVDTNSRHIAKVLAKAGFSIRRVVTIPDEMNVILKTLEELYLDSNLILTTGGLGPTFDDLTVDAIARFFNRKLALNQQVYNQIVAYLKSRKRKARLAHKRQAFLPEGSWPLVNGRGIAPGLFIREKELFLMAMPGVPYEMAYMLENYVVPTMKKYFVSNAKRELLIKTASVPESVLERKLRHLMKSNEKVDYGIYPHLWEVEIRVSITAKNKKEAVLLEQKEKKKFEKCIADVIYGYNDETLAEKLVAALKRNRWTISVAESCTGGWLAKELTDVAGASRVFRAGEILYSNESKVALGVPQEIIQRHGAVSTQAARAMAKIIAEKKRAEVGIAITGIAGPGGGTKEKPVGTVYIAIYVKGKLKTYPMRFTGLREHVRHRSVKAALFYCLKLIS